VSLQWNCGLERRCCCDALQSCPHGPLGVVLMGRR
jgi:hypothetical protein